MTRAPFVMAKAESAFSRDARLEDTTIGWRFVNPRMQAAYGTDSMPRRRRTWPAVRHLARRPGCFALRSQQRCAAAVAAGRLAEEIVPVSIPQRKATRWPSRATSIARRHTLAALAKLKGIVRPEGTVTAGNAPA